VHNSTYKKVVVQWLNEALCFVSSLVLADSFRLRNRQLLVAAKRHVQHLFCVTFLLNLDMHIDNPKIDQIRELCKENRVKTLFAFGSVTRDDFNADSDIDLVVDFEEKDPFIYSDLYLNLKSKLEDILNRQVDLLEERAIKNRFFRQQLESTKVPLYGN